MKTLQNYSIVKKRIQGRYEAVNLKKEKAGQPKFTHETFSEACGVSVNTVDKWLGWKSEANPKADNLVALADALECDVEYLLGVQDTPRRVVFDVCASTGLTEEAAETLVKLAKKENKTKKEIESCDMFLYLISALILSDVPACIAPAIYTKGREGTIRYNRDEWETLSAEANVALQKLRAQESLFLFINQLRVDHGLDPLE
ncbi:MAG: helix-turn-helix transcriptional regulator [Clostridiales bacterium]|nr:helix-turn-helix transcriptional regulator [Clostridiales bacterium]